jgi:hypothetical protein
VLDAGGVKPGTAKRYRVSLRQLDGHFSGMTFFCDHHCITAGRISGRQPQRTPKLAINGHAMAWALGGTLGLPIPRQIDVDQDGAAIN